jgi:hypothetical protein|tara:strand:- start:14 stop:748 length:735 start_codon:yes stop_codon:yes gene_type:complete
VDELIRIKKISIWIFIVPFVAVNICLLISVNYELLENTFFTVDAIGKSGFTIPYIDGSLSISRSARTYPAYLVFKPGMIVTGILLIQYWSANRKLFKKLDQKNTRRSKYFLFFGIGSAIFLIFHSIFLGFNLESDFYKFFRRFVLLGFIIFELIAQGLLVFSLIKIKNEINHIINKKILAVKMILVSVLIIVAILSAPILNSSEYTHFKHALEWNYFLGVITFYLLTHFFWKFKKPPVHTPEGV